jgi:antitoxin ParD1/3/4
MLMRINMTLKLRADIEHIVKEKVKSGQYKSLEEAANEMIEAAHKQETLSDQDIEELRREVALGIDEADRGEFSELTIDQIIVQEKPAARKKRAG